MNALGEAATHLPWLSPGADALLALTRPSAPGSWAQMRADPGGVLLLLRETTPDLTAPPSLPALLHDRPLLDGALRHLAGGGDGFVDWNRPEARPIYQTAWTFAWVAQELATRTGRFAPEAAWVAGLLAPLGWLAVCAVDPQSAAACLHHPGCASAASQRRLWGLDQASIVRRLARRWQLPHWLAAVIGHLHLSGETAAVLGAHADLFLIVQTAVRLVQEKKSVALLVVPRSNEIAAEDLALPEPPSQIWRSPASVPLLTDLLCLAAENRRLAQSAPLERLETEVDQLHRLVEEHRTGEGERLQTMKLTALAELAAGAAHEINNPLAVISGQAQHLLGHEPDPSRQRALHAIINQAHRVHQVLSEMMQFARPAKPRKEIVDLTVLLREVTLSQADLADQRKVRLNPPELERLPTLEADPRQVRTALSCLLRNAIEAAPADGWAGVRVETAANRLDFIVEDSGPGPTPAQREHMFDPFYSGRPAGRGKGLGLSTAWRLARENGGEVRYEAAAGPTRFVLSLPLAALPPPLAGPHFGNTSEVEKNGVAGH